MADLITIRNEIDKIDNKIVELFEERMGLSRQVAEYKIKNGMQVFDKGRELDKLSTLKGLAQDDFNQHGVEELFTQIMAMSRKLQYQLLAQNGINGDLPFDAVERINLQNVKVVYQGVPGAYSHEAMLDYFGWDVANFNVKTWREAMEAIRCGQADYAVLPIENSSAGIVNEVYDLLVEFDNYIIANIDVLVEHALLGLPDAEIGDIKTVYSHPQALMQSAKFLEDNKEWQSISMLNTAVAALKVVEDKDITQAAIASRNAAKLYGLKILKEKINFSESNTTRFIVVANQNIYKKDAGKISVCFELPHESGTLYNMLSHFIYNNLSMTKIESRPLEGKNWEYRFFVEFEGNLNDASVKNALRGIAEEAISFKILGNY